MMLTCPVMARTPRRPLQRWRLGICVLALSTWGAAGAVPQGRLWHSYGTVGGADRGLFVSPLDGGPPATVLDDKFASVDPRGTQLISKSYDAGDERTAVRITAPDGRSLMRFSVDGYFTDLLPAPGGRALVLGRWSKSFLAPRHTVVYDPSAGQLLFATRESEAGDAFGWLPDGRLLRVQASGAISSVALDGHVLPLGAVRWPPGWQLGAVFVSPTGRQVALRLDSEGGREHDLWTMGLDGRDLARFTTTGMTTYAVWSPQGDYLAFDKDTGASCSNATCRGSCRLWYAPASARGVVAVEASRDASAFVVKARSGAAMPLGCHLRAWTP